MMESEIFYYLPNYAMELYFWMDLQERNVFLLITDLQIPAKNAQILSPRKSPRAMGKERL